jgi:hypothetical protein
METDSKEYSWAWVTADRLLTDHECELVYAYMAVSGAETDTHLRNGVDANADIVVTLKSAVVTGLPFSPPVPIYCRKGLFADIGSATSGLLVVWRNL